MATEDEKREARNKYERERRYRKGLRTPGWTPGKKKEPVLAAIERQQSFKARYPDAKGTLDEWESIGILKDYTERLAFEKYHGVDGQLPATMAEIGQELRVSRQRVDQIIKAVLARIEVHEAGGEVRKPPKEKAKAEEPPKRRGRPPKAKAEVIE